MGWTSYNANFYKNGKVDKKEEIKSIFQKDDGYKILKISSVGNTFYMAIERFIKEERIVFGAVYLTSTNMKDYYNFSYKDMDETCGPCYYDCPESILKLLSPTDNKFALEWREKCWANIKEKKEKKKNPNSLKNLPIGSIIEMKYWEEGIETIQLKKIDYPRYKNPIWYSSETGYKYKPSTIENQGYKVVSKNEAV